MARLIPIFPMHFLIKNTLTSTISVFYAFLDVLANILFTFCTNFPKQEGAGLVQDLALFHVPVPVLWSHLQVLQSPQAVRPPSTVWPVIFLITCFTESHPKDFEIWNKLQSEESLHKAIENI